MTKVGHGYHSHIDYVTVTNEVLRAGARADECDANGFKPFHRALENGDKKMLDYFFDAFPPYSHKGEKILTNMKVYEPVNPEDPATSLVMLATRTGDAEVIDYVLDRSTLEEVEHAYRYTQAQLRQARFHKPTSVRWKNAQRMLEQKEGFSPPLEFALRNYHRPQHSVRGGKTWHKNRNQVEKPRRNEKVMPTSQNA